MGVIFNIQSFHPDQVTLSAADWRYQTDVKKYRIFSRVLFRLFSVMEIFV